eukprot:7133867-Pyramimonas_sp.AAC.1
MRGQGRGRMLTQAPSVPSASVYGMRWRKHVGVILSASLLWQSSRPLSSRSPSAGFSSWSVITANVNAYSSLQPLLVHGEFKAADAILVQETHLYGHRCAESEAELGKLD